MTLLDLKTLRTNLLNQVRNKDNYVHYGVAVRKEAELKERKRRKVGGHTGKGKIVRA